MTDPFSVVVGAAGLISLGIQVTQSLVNFYNARKDQISDLQNTNERLEDLLFIFRCLEKTLAGRIFQEDEQGLIRSVDMSIESCNDSIQELQDECQKFGETASNGIKATIRVAGRRVAYPFRQSTLQKIDENITEIRANVFSAL